jgi:hypothetical protein
VHQLPHILADQDGYFIGDNRTNDSNLTNQCWKFYSDNSFSYNDNYLAMGSE